MPVLAEHVERAVAGRRAVAAEAGGDALADLAVLDEVQLALRLADAEHPALGLAALGQLRLAGGRGDLGGTDLVRPRRRHGRRGRRDGQGLAQAGGADQPQRHGHAEHDPDQVFHSGLSPCEPKDIQASPRWGKRHRGGRGPDHHDPRGVEVPAELRNCPGTVGEPPERPRSGRGVVRRSWRESGSGLARCRTARPCGSGRRPGSPRCTRRRGRTPAPAPGPCSSPGSAAPARRRWRSGRW